MQTFLPYADFRESARCLDPSRLGNQYYREGVTLLRGGWQHHPASKMWRGYDWALCAYMLALADELKSRGLRYPNTDREVLDVMIGCSHEELPWWLGNAHFHSTHRAALLRKDFEWYSQFGWDEEPDPMPDGKFQYYWPVT